MATVDSMSLVIPKTLAAEFLCKLAVAAQPVIEAGSVEYCWGRSIADKAGDNLDQFGLHGTCQAAIAFAQAVTAYGDRSHFRKYRDGARKYLIRLATAPHKTSDERKTLKVAEHLEALCNLGADSSVTMPIIERLRKCANRNGGICGWGFDLEEDSEESSVLPSIYTLRALMAASQFSERPELSEDIRYGLDYVVNTIQQNINGENIDYLNMLVLAIAMYGKKAENVGLRNKVIEIVRNTIGQFLGMDNSRQIDYHYGTNGGSTHAYCTVQSGCLQLGVELWVARERLDVGLASDRLKVHYGELLRLARPVGEIDGYLVEVVSKSVCMLLSFDEVIRRTVFISNIEDPGEDNTTENTTPVTNVHADDTTEVKQSVFRWATKHPGSAWSALSVIVAAIPACFYFGGHLNSKELDRLNSEIKSAEQRTTTETESAKASEAKADILLAYNKYEDAMSINDVGAAQQWATRLRELVKRESERYLDRKPQGTNAYGVVIHPASALQKAEIEFKPSGDRINVPQDLLFPVASPATAP